MKSLIGTLNEYPRTVTMERNKLILTLHYIKLAEAILKMRDPNIKTFDGNIKNYPAFKVSSSILERQGIDKISC